MELSLELNLKFWTQFVGPQFHDIIVCENLRGEKLIEINFICNLQICAPKSSLKIANRTTTTTTLGCLQYVWYIFVSFIPYAKEICNNSKNDAYDTSPRMMKYRVHFDDKSSSLQCLQPRAFQD
jgi:hypothetical protein